MSPSLSVFVCLSVYPDFVFCLDCYPHPFLHMFSPSTWCLLHANVWSHCSINNSRLATVLNTAHPLPSPPFPPKTCCRVHLLLNFMVGSCLDWLRQTAFQSRSVSCNFVFTMSSKHCGSLHFLHMVQQYSTTAIQQYSSTAMQQYSNTAVQQYSNIAIQQYSSTAIQQYSITAAWRSDAWLVLDKNVSFRRDGSLSNFPTQAREVADDCHILRLNNMVGLSARHP